MNAEKELNRLWLLVESGEGTEQQQEEFARLRASDPAMDGQIAEWRWLCEQAASSPELDGPSQATLGAIMAAAAARRPRRRLRLVHFGSPTLRVLAYAAAAAIVVSGWLAIGPGTQHSPVVAQHDVQALLLTVADVQADTADAEASAGTDLDSLADQLLDFQGFGGQSDFEDGLISFLQDEPSTVPQARRTPASQAGICG